MSDCKFKATDRTGLYVMVFIILVQIFAIGRVLKEVHKETQSLTVKVEALRIQEATK